MAITLTPSTALPELLGIGCIASGQLALCCMVLVMLDHRRRAARVPGPIGAPSDPYRN